jgi:transcriptional accessory protein Tex/SPT6
LPSTWLARAQISAIHRVYRAIFPQHIGFCCLRWRSRRLDGSGIMDELIIDH